MSYRIAIFACGFAIYKDGAVFPRPGLARVPHVQHMGTMDESWARASPPSSMAMVGQLGGGSTKHLSGLGSRGLRPRAFEPRSSTGAVRGSLRCGAPMVGSPSWQGRGDESPRPPRRGDRSFLMFFFCRSGLRCAMCFRFCVLGLIISRLLAAVSRFLYSRLPLPLPAVIEYSLASRSLTGMCVWRRNQRSQRSQYHFSSFEHL